MNTSRSISLHLLFLIVVVALLLLGVPGGSQAADGGLNVETGAVTPLWPEKHVAAGPGVALELGTIPREFWILGNHKFFLETGYIENAIGIGGGVSVLPADRDNRFRLQGIWWPGDGFQFGLRFGVPLKLQF